MGDQFTGYVIANTEEDRYRWYLCIEKQPEAWTCQRTTADAVLGGVKTRDRTKTIPIHYTNPPFLDRLYIRAALQPSVKIIKPVCAEHGPE
jgi:hypothetical protein